ncbi:MAG: hypothetical protein M0Q42_00315 [Xanthomonadales bacterium]|nr:hypothetical protein [Xanthomonadales bacterium]
MAAPLADAAGVDAEKNVSTAADVAADAIDPAVAEADAGPDHAGGDEGSEGKIDSAAGSSGFVDTAAPAAPMSAPAPTPTPAPASSHRHVAANLLEVHTRTDAVHPAARANAVQEHLSGLGTQLAAGDLAAARGHLEQLDELLPRRSLTLLRSRAWYALVAGDDVVARGHYAELAARLPGDREATINLAIAEARLGEHDAALHRLQRLLGSTEDGWRGDGQAQALMRSVHRMRESAALARDGQALP